jgi:hypothetical protein
MTPFGEQIVVSWLTSFGFSVKNKRIIALESLTTVNNTAPVHRSLTIKI